MTDDENDERDVAGVTPSVARKKSMTPAGSAIADFMAELRAATAGIDWDAHDAKVNAARERAEARAERERTSDRARLLARPRPGPGFPIRALEVATAPDLTGAPVDALRAYVGDRTILVLSGPVSCGKTVAACWWTLHRSQRSAQFVRASAFAASSRYDREAREELQAAGVLVLDDLGAEYADSKGNLLADLEELVDVFYASRRHLIITTNVPAAEFPARYGDRIASRLREAGRWIELGKAPPLRPAPRNQKPEDSTR